MIKRYTWQRYGLAVCLPLLLLHGPGAVAAPARPVLHMVADWQLTGKIMSPSGEGLPGVTVVLKGTTIGTTSNVDGTFALAVPEAAGTLVFSSIGFKTQEHSFSGAENITIKLVDDNKALDEVVVVGYGTQKRGDVTGAIATLDARKLEERPIARVDQALVGQLAGVVVKQTSGVPGRAFSIQVRGAGSISAGSEPLYVIDGFPLESVAANGGGRFSSGNPLDNINPNDIEKIEVLKDAAAAAIYGSRAANGVVLITTKRGKSGKPQISVNSYAGGSRAAKRLDVLSGEEWASRATEIINNNWVKSGTGRTAGQTTAQRRTILGLTGNNVNPDLMLDDRWAMPGHPGLTYIDWQDQLYRTGISQNYQVSASGATDNVNYYVSGNYNDQQGFALGLDYKRYSARANVEVKASDKLRFGLTLTPTYSISTDPGIEGKDNRFHQLLAETPIVEDTAGVNTGYGKNDVYRWGVSTASPIAVIKAFKGDTRTFRTLGTVFGELQPIPGLRLRSTLNFDNNDVTSKSYQPATRNLATSLASGSYSGFRRQTFVNENTVTYNKVLGKNDFSALAGYSYNFSKLDNVALAASGGFINNTVTTLNGATNITGTGSNFTTETQSVLLSYFGRLQYAYDGKYLLSASVRRDASSRFGFEDRAGVFPAVSAGWRLSQESFLQPVAFLSDLKLRGSLGYSGNNTIGDYSSIATLGFANYAFGGTSGVQVTGQAPNKVGNSQLKWERNRTIDFGVDFGLFKNRIVASADIYTKTSQDLLLNVPVPTAAGFGTNLVNIGEVRNKGWEVELSTRNLEGALSWNTSFNLSHNENVVVHLGPGDGTIEVPNGLDTPSNILKVGLPIYSLFVVRQTGILSQSDIDNKAALFGAETAGDPKYEDFNGDGKIDSNDRQVVGNPNPTYTFGMTNTVRYKGFDLSFLVQGQRGGSIYSTLGRAIDRTSVGYKENALGRVRDRWFSAENPGDGIKGKATGSFGFIRNTDWLYSSDYYRVRSITLGYDLGLIIKKSVAQGARVYVTAENWFGHDNYYGGLNPDALNTSNSGTFVSGSDYGGLPLAKTLVLGLNLTF
ncbi:SusC/RagA family TonB-linked outer membrane protein [Hymenobacter sedentarius]|uniref:SusC/RagA family TonB-linked outer membrane protein n=1 Tax=Hymenobacter sedentarius TaxID=1411621 RepID=A0A0U4AX25_9BACT|nr:TonB-dependent receptor [Hymenobacter sedentarius]ALW85293.1 SusC/RagA family TonB-linked outer membrane protein [Hymenobacter sedentarius]